MTKKRSVPEEEVLFPDLKIGDVICRPWSFKKLFQIANILDRILTELEKDSLLKLFDEFGNIIPSTVTRLIFRHQKEIFEIISATIDKPVEWVEELSAEEGLQFAITVFQQNRESIKNVFAPLIGAIGAVALKDQEETS